MVTHINHIGELKKGNDNRVDGASYDVQTLGQRGDIMLPLPPENDGLHDVEMEVYARFMRHLRHVPHSREDIKILTSIQFVADMLDYTDGQVARMLVDMGLRAPRLAFPADFLNFVDRSLMRGDWEVESARASMKELKQYWDEMGEDKFAWLKKDYVFAQPRLSECV